MSTDTIVKDHKQFLGKEFVETLETSSKSITCKRFTYSSELEQCLITLHIYQYGFKPISSLEKKYMYRAEVLIEDGLSLATEVYSSEEDCEKAIQDKVRQLYRRTLLEAGSEDPQFLALYLLIFDNEKQN